MSDNEEIIIDKEKAVSPKDEQIIRFSRRSTDYVYSTSEGKELNVNVAKTINLLDAQPEPSDDDFCDICIAEKELASLIKVNSKNLHQDLVKGDFLNELRTSAFISQKKNDKGEIVYAEILNAISYVKYEDGKLYVRKNPDMKKFSLNLGKNNPYFEIFRNSANSLPKHKQIELYKLIENELSRFQYELGMKTKSKMLQDHTWRELKVSIFKIRQSTFTLETYLENHNFVSILLKRQLKTISENTDIEIDWKSITTNKRGDDAEYVIMSVRRKEISYSVSEDSFRETAQVEKYFEDDELNKEFSVYLQLIGISEKLRIEAYKKRLEECVKDTLPLEEEFNIDIALRIIRRAIRGGENGVYRDFSIIKTEEIQNYQNNNDRSKVINNSSSRTSDKLKKLEDYYLNQNT